MQGIGGQAAENFTMNVHGGDGRVAVFGEAGLVESRYGDVLGNAAPRGELAFDNAYGGQIVDGHDCGGARRQLRDS